MTLENETVDRRLWCLCGLFKSKVRDGRGVTPRLRGEGAIGVCAAREGT